MRRILGIESQAGTVRTRDHNVRVETHPLGIDTEDFREKAYSQGAEQYLRQLKRNIGDRQVILGVDRLDYTKGLPLKLQAFERLLERSPRWAERVLFFAARGSHAGWNRNLPRIEERSRTTGQRDKRHLRLPVAESDQLPVPDRDSGGALRVVTALRMSASYRRCATG